MSMGEVPAGARRSGMIGGLVNKSFKTTLVAIVIAGLVLMNVLTLLSDRVHSTAFGLFEGVLASVLTDAALSRVTGKSPTVQRKSDVVRATKQLSDRNKQLVTSHAALQTKHDSLERNHRRLDTEHKALTTRIKTQNAKIAEVSKRLATRTIANAGRNTASLAGQAIPVVGTGLILGVTAWDVYDACEFMKESNHLNALIGEMRQDESKVCGIKLPSKERLLDDIRADWKAAYSSAALAINAAGTAMVPITPPNLSWNAAKGPLCATLGKVPAICP